ncbi:MAG: hypothetical protein R3261_08050, partial [Alphaproteobacteria bacterium]|nr:hypothetical protein [Alphaproteobacteria bacterium]
SSQIDQQIKCDLNLLHKLGLSAIAPPFSDDIFASYDRARGAGFIEVLAYTPMKRNHASVKAFLANHGAEDLYFSIADEASASGQAGMVPELHKFLQNESPFAKTAGHLNHPRDRKLLKYFDLVLINPGFGVDNLDVDRLKQLKKKVWFYNMPAPRLAAGFYLWRVSAEGYLQWHGRMPTADPFDPTDGREDDVQMLYPSESVCSEKMDVDIALIQMVNGLSDLHWLRWLDLQAKTQRDARQLRDRVFKKVAGIWATDANRQAAYWEILKSEIQELAFRLQN